jgi:hypothetical protein
MHEQHLQKGMFVKAEFLALSQSLKGVLKNVTCMLSLQLNRRPLCHQFMHSSLSYTTTITQQVIKCLIFIQRGKFISFPLHHLMFFPN